MLCAEFSAVKHVSHALAIVPLACRCWHCEECAPTRRRQLVAQGILGQPSVFLTLTVNPHRYEYPAERARRLTKAWREVRRRAIVEAARDPRRQPRPHGLELDPKRSGEADGVVPRQVRLAGGSLPFLAVFEKTGAGEPHLHILARAEWIGQDWLSKQMQQFMGAPIVHVERVYDAGRVASYVAKYMAKDPSKFGSCKRYWMSPDWILPSTREPAQLFYGKGGWKRVRERWDQVVESCRGLFPFEVVHTPKLIVLQAQPP